VKKILIVDAEHHSGSTWLDNISTAKGALVVRASKIVAGRFDELVIVDYGTALSRDLVAKAVVYRAEHRDCRVSITRVLSDDWSDTEALARVHSDPTTTPGDSTMALDRIAELALHPDRVKVRIDAHAVLLEYAA
jgi:hypothetical protein